MDNTDTFLKKVLAQAIEKLEGVVPLVVDLAAHRDFVESERLKDEWEPSHGHTEILLVVSGREIITVKGNPVLVTAPSVVHVAPWLKHNERPSRRGNAFSALWIGFGEKPIIGVHSTWFDPKRHPWPEYHLTGQRQLPSGRYDLARAVTLMRTGSRPERLFGRNVLQNFLAEALMLTLEKVPDIEAAHLRAIEKAHAFVQENFTRPIGLADIARQVGYSSDHLSRLFKKEFGKSPVSLISEMRMAKAADLLANTELKILGISTDLGFFSVNHFHRVFKEHYKMTPAEYRKRLPIR